MENILISDQASKVQKTPQEARLAAEPLKDIHSDESSLAEFARSASARHLRLNNYLYTLTTNQS